MSRNFGLRNPFDDPFFTTPSRSLFEHSLPLHVHSSKAPVIEELDSDGEGEFKEEHVEGGDEKKDKYKENAWANQNPLVEHPEDQSYDHNTSEGSKKEIPNLVDNEAEVAQPRARTVSFQRVTYGGINGSYYTATTTRRAGSNGVVLEERKEADKTTGEATHSVSRGIHDKGHSFTRKLGSDGQVDTTQTLHNLHEDELSSFEQAWKGNANRQFSRWNDGFDRFTNAENGDRDLKNWTKFALPFREDHSSSGGTDFPLRDRFSSFGGMGLDRDEQCSSTQGKPKKVVTINIE